MMDDGYQTLSSRIAWENPWYAVREDRVRFPDGSEGEYAVVVKNPAVYVVPVTGGGKIVLLRHYRYPLERWQWEIPAGSVEAGMTLEEAARAELREEVGGQAVTLQPVGSFATTPGYGTEEITIYVAQGVRLGEPAREASELMETHQFAPERVLRMAINNEIADGPSALAILLCVPQLLNSSQAIGRLWTTESDIETEC